MKVQVTQPSGSCNLICIRKHIPRSLLAINCILPCQWSHPPQEVFIPQALQGITLLPFIRANTSQRLTGTSGNKRTRISKPTKVCKLAAPIKWEPFWQFPDRHLIPAPYKFRISRGIQERTQPHAHAIHAYALPLR